MEFNMYRYMANYYCFLLKKITISGIIFSSMLSCMFIFCVYASENSTSFYHFKNTLPAVMEEIDFKWPCPYLHRRSNYIKLLKPYGYAEKKHLTAGSLTEIHLFNKNIQMRVTAIKKKVLPPAKKIGSNRLRNHYLNKYSMVTAIFVHQSPVVKTYRFSNAVTHNITALNVTPEHPFYVRELKQFLAVAKIKPWMSLDANGGISHIVSEAKDYNKYNSTKTTTVYNIETRRHHVYRVGSHKILVHNCNSNFLAQQNTEREGGAEIEAEHAEKIQDSKNQLADALMARGDHDEQEIEESIEQYNVLVSKNTQLHLQTDEHKKCKWLNANRHHRVMRGEKRLLKTSFSIGFDKSELEEMPFPETETKYKIAADLDKELLRQPTLRKGKAPGAYPPFKAYAFHNKKKTSLIYDNSEESSFLTLKMDILTALFGEE